MTDHEIFVKVIDKVVLSDDMTVLQFGLASGNTLLAILDSFAAKGKIPTQIIAFDGFVGLIKEAEGVPKQEDWVENAFNLIWEIKNNRLLNINVGSIKEGINLVWNRFEDYWEYLDFVVGLYSDTLNKKTIRSYNIEPASYIDIDCDLYISCKQALDFIFENNLMLPDCVIRFDDWNMRDIAEGDGGESRAYFETVKKYGAMFERLDSESHDAVFRYKGLKNENY